MFFCVAFVGIMAIIVLSSSATAQATHTDRIQETLQYADSHLSGDYQSQAYPISTAHQTTPHSTPYFDDEPVVYDSNRYEIERMQDDIANLQDKQMDADGYDTDFSDRITDGIYAMIIILIAAFILYGVCEWIEEKTSYTYKPDTPDAQPYDRRAAQVEIEKEWE